MTIVNDNTISQYLETVIDKMFKILPLYEENNETLDVYIESLVFELTGFISKYGGMSTTDYISIMSTLEGIRITIKTEGNQPEVKREVFKCINVVIKIRKTLEGD